MKIAPIMNDRISRREGRNLLLSFSFYFSVVRFITCLF